MGAAQKSIENGPPSRNAFISYPIHPRPRLGASRRARISYNYPESTRSIWKIEIFRKLSPAVTPLRHRGRLVLSACTSGSGSIASYYRRGSEKCFFKSLP